MNIFSGFSESEKSRVKYVISDVDDTITSDGLLLPQALDALYKLRESGIKTILVTGGSAGWADGYIRQWPVDAVIAESGAVLIYKNRGSITYMTNPLISEDKDFALKRARLLEETKDYVFSSDQYARIYDVAYEKKALSRDREEKLYSIIKSLDGTALVSSIHVNVLFSPISKKKGFDVFFPQLKDILDMEEELTEVYENSLALGDSLNDEALFQSVKLSVGNKRVLDSYNSFKYPPTYVTELYGGKSFALVIGDLLSG